MTRDPERIDDVLGLVRAIWEEYPDLRLGQLLLNIVRYGAESRVYGMEDDELMERLRETYDVEDTDAE